MRPVLLLALAATLLASAALALWPDPPEAADAATAVVAPVRRPVAAASAVAAAQPAVAPAAATAPADATPAAQLPTRAADWPAPSPAGLAAWQTVATAGANRSAAAVVAAVGAAVGAASAASAASRPAAVFPYRWIGQLDDGDGAPQQLLASEQRSVGVRLGATLDGRWRLLRNDAGRLLAQALPDGEALPVPGAPAANPAMP